MLEWLRWPLAGCPLRVPGRLTLVRTTSFLDGGTTWIDGLDERGQRWRDVLAARGSEQMAENLSDPVLGELDWRPAEKCWGGRVEVGPEESAELVIFFDDNEVVGDVTTQRMLGFAREQLRRIREGLDRYRRQAAREMRKRHPQRSRPRLRNLSEGDLAAGLAVTSIQFSCDFNTTLALGHPECEGEILVYLDPNGKADKVEF